MSRDSRHVRTMARPQFSTEQRNFIFVEYVKHKGQRSFFEKIIRDFNVKFPGVRSPTKAAMKKIYRKQMTFHTCHNLCSKASPGETHSGRPRSARTPQKIALVRQIVEEDAAKSHDDPTVR